MEEEHAYLLEVLALPNTRATSLLTFPVYRERFSICPDCCITLSSNTYTAGQSRDPRLVKFHDQIVGTLCNCHVILQETVESRVYWKQIDNFVSTPQQKAAQTSLSHVRLFWEGLARTNPGELYINTNKLQKN